MLLDSSVFIHWSRRKQNPTLRLKPYVIRGEIETCGVVRAEVLRGAKQPARWTELLTRFDAMQDIPASISVWDRTANLAWTLDRRGTPLPLPDLIIAACALEAAVPLVTFDGHFNAIPGLTVYPDLP